MRTYTFVKKENRDYGYPGLILENAPDTYYPLSGMGVAHDVMEHHWNDDGSVRDEIMALGAALYVRGEEYWNGRFFSNPGDQISPDLIDLFHSWLGGDYLPHPGRTLKLPDDEEGWIEKACENVAKELDCEEASEVKEFVEKARGWLRKGFRQAALRYRNAKKFELPYIFMQIEKAADTHISREDYDSIFIVKFKNNGEFECLSKPLFDIYD